MKLKNRRALVTGGSKGIGQAISLALAQEGCSVVINYHKSSEDALLLQNNIQQLGLDALAVQADVSNPTSIEYLCQTAVTFLGGLDILVNCAGIMQQCSIDTLELDEWNRVINTNLTSAYLTAKTCLEALKQSTSGRIINISSQAAFTGSKNRAAYCAAKSGLHGLTYSLAKEFGEFGITANLISPGRIATDMIYEDSLTRSEEWLSATPLKRFGDSGEIASVVSFLASDDASYITGANIHVNGGILMG